MRHLALLILLASFVPSCARPAAAPRSGSPPAFSWKRSEVLVERWPKPQPPVPTRREAISETLHGVRVDDPYRWLENASDPAVSAWIDAQNALLKRTLSAVADREQLRSRLETLLEIGSISVPALARTRGGAVRLFYKRREGKQEQPILYVREGARGSERVLVDPNAAATDGTTSLDWSEPSQDGSLLVYGMSQSGTEDSVLRVRDVQSGRDLPVVIDRTRHASVAWLPDNSGFYYSRYPRPGTVPAGDERYYRKIYQHRLGTDPESDALIFGEGLPATDYPSCEVSPDREARWLLVTVTRGWSESALYLADRKAPKSTFRRITPEGQNRYFGTPRADALYVLTNEGAPRYRLYRVDPRKPEREHWHLLVGEHPNDVINSYTIASKQLLIAYESAGLSRLERFDLEGKSLGPVELPTLGASDGFSALHDGDEAYYGFESFAFPPMIRRLDLRTGKTEEWETVKADIATSDYVVASHEARSRDGTLVPYRVVHHRRLKPDGGSNPTLLYGYGGFNVSLQPRFSRSAYAWLERGGVYVQANLRGGGEFGESWHRAGQLERKQNVFDDLYAVAEDLIARKLTSPKHLGVLGRSNGGLLVAAAVTQRPELFRAAVAGVPLTDMIRYPRFLIAKLWTTEYGSPDDPEAFRHLFAYSPYHRVKPGVAYPALLVTTAESDTRVDPLHARKFVAQMQYATSAGGERPVLLRTERKAGHGAGTPVSKLVEELTDQYTFLFHELGVSPEPR